MWTEGLLIAWACCCALFDYRQRRLPNTLTLGAAGVAMVYLLIYGKSMLGAPLLSALVAGIAVVFLLMPCLCLGWLGAGDIKLMSAIGFIGGPQILAITFVFSSFMSLPLVLWLSKGRTGHRQPDPAKTQGFPQGVFIALGLMLAMFGANGGSSA